MFLSGERLRSWPKAYLDEVGPHKNTFKASSVSLRGDAAVVIIRDTGSNRSRSWSNEEVSWFLGRVNGQCLTTRMARAFSARNFVLCAAGEDTLSTETDEPND